MTYSGDPGTTGINGEKVFLEKKKKKQMKEKKMYSEGKKENGREYLIAR